MQALRRLYAKLHLRANEAKSAVALVQDRKFLGSTFWLSPKNEVRCTIARKALKTMKDRVRRMTSRMRGRSLAQVCQDLRVYLPGWRATFRLIQLPGVFRDRARGSDTASAPCSSGNGSGASPSSEGCARWDSRPPTRDGLPAMPAGWWRTSGMGPIHVALPIKHFDELGLPRLAT